MRFKLAIVGRPNVGKSTLFNRLVGKRLALVDDQPGVTRDRRLAEGSLGDLHFDVIDTAGILDVAPQSLEARMRQQTEAAVAEADIVLFLIDARAGVTPADSEIAEVLRRTARAVIVVANKVESKAGEAGYFEAYDLGWGEPVAISAEHGLGLADLHQAISAKLGLDAAPADAVQEEEQDDIAALRIAVVGRPNVGKSTLINRLVGEERLLTGPEAGITRDSIVVDWEWRGHKIRLFDTAGMRRKARVTGKLEKLSVADGLRAVKFAEIVIVVIDATAPFEKQDLHIADHVIGEGRAPVIALNKWDLIEDRRGVLAELEEKAGRLLPQIRGMKVVPVSAARGDGIDDLMKATFDVYDAWNRRVPTAQLNRWLEGAVAHHPPPAVSGRRIRIKYITQIKTRPPTFMASCPRPAELPEAYRRYMINGLREAFDLMATPIRLVFRKGENPFEGKAQRG
jgi:GTPase